MIAGGERQGDRGRDVSVQQPLLAHPVLHESGPLLHLLRLLPSLLVSML